VRLFTTIAGLRCHLDLHRSGRISLPSAAPPRIGLVPTMGALHAGHLSLIKRAAAETDLVIVSIFVNPTQFAPHEDFDRYPRQLERDRQLCEQSGVEVIFAPNVSEMYGTPTAEVTQVLPPAAMLTGLCGASRPGHFQGVATVVTKLFNIVQPDRAYFGQKDAQQLAILRQITQQLNLPVEIVPCPIVREPSGLAMSSRNQYLSADEREQAIALYRGLMQAESTFRGGKRTREAIIAAVRYELEKVPAVKTQYIELVHPETLIPLSDVDEVGLLAIAAQVGQTRLIDNVTLKGRKPILAIDGPAGAGKSTVVRMVAQNLGLLYLDTGAMYRSVTWLALASQIDLEDEAAIAELLSQCDIDISGDPSAVTVRVNAQDVTTVIRSPEITANVSAIAALAAVRQELVKRQQAYGRKGGVVMEGRDIGTHVFPDAELKIFLTASVAERARRRYQDLLDQGYAPTPLLELEQTIAERDRKDSTRAIAPLRQAADAVEIQTDNLTIEEVVAKIVSLYEQKLTEI
jgi:pantoate ligase / CMP/dCMP kinase